MRDCENWVKFGV